MAYILQKDEIITVKQISYLNILKTVAVFCVCAVHMPLMPLFSESVLSNFSQMLLHIGVPIFALRGVAVNTAKAVIVTAIGSAIGMLLKKLPI